MTDARIITGDARVVLAELPAESVQCCVTSPPYWGLRDYGVDGQIGLEASLPEWIDQMVAVFRAVRRVLRNDGVLWLNLGDSYAGGGRGGGSEGSKQRTNVGSLVESDAARARKMIASRRRDNEPIPRSDVRVAGLKPKDLVGQPWRVAFALQDDGWYLRQDIIWSKPNPMPESVRDRCTKAHEYVFLLSKSARYFYDATAARESVTGGAHPRKVAGWAEGPRDHSAVGYAKDRGGKTKFAGNGVGFGHGFDKVPKPRVKSSDVGARLGHRGPGWREEERLQRGFGRTGEGSFDEAHDGQLVNDRNMRSVWTIPTEPFSEAHFATFPTALARRWPGAASSPAAGPAIWCWIHSAARERPASSRSSWAAATWASNSNRNTSRCPSAGWPA